jgi:hypothetical protein
VDLDVAAANVHAKSPWPPRRNSISVTFSLCSGRQVFE